MSPMGGWFARLDEDASVADRASADRASSDHASSNHASCRGPCMVSRTVHRVAAIAAGVGRFGFSSGVRFGVVVGLSKGDPVRRGRSIRSVNRGAIRSLCADVFMQGVSTRIEERR